MSSTVWRFEAMDTLFFRDGRPMNAGESAWVDSIFPPSGQSLQGAIRAAILDHWGVEIKAFQEGIKGRLNQDELLGKLYKEIGDQSALGDMRLTGGFVENKKQLLFPVPLDLVKNEHNEFALLKPDNDPVESDLGFVRLPGIAGAGFKPMEQKYINHSAMEKLLASEPGSLKVEHVFSSIAESADETKALCDREYKVGLARDNEKRTAKEGMLFTIAPLRPRKDIRIAVQVDGVGIDTQPKGNFVQKLGGEGKLAYVEITEAPLELPKIPRLHIDGDRIRFRLVFTTPALMPENHWLPAKFQAKTDQHKAVRWSGKLNGCNIDIVAACIAKPVKIGGWNLAGHRPEDLRAFIPAGSVYFSEAKSTELDGVKKLHRSKLGEKTEYGYGQVLLGTW